jgi:aspartate/methionine/tyrosine aminotransferase
MKIEPFDLERGQSLWEHLVDINLSESGVHPVCLADLREMGMDLGELEKTPLAYVQTNGTIELREALAALYPGATVDHIEVTNGTSEANFIASHILLEPGDEVLFQVPNYVQIAGIARNLGATVNTFALRRDRVWHPDWEEFDRRLGDRTRLVYVSHPNNPTGYIFSTADMERIVDAVERVDAYLIADEVYRGAEHAGDISPSFWGMSDRVIVTSGLSKAYGIPGVRIGWIVGPSRFIETCWSLHDYTTIAPGALSDLVARFAVHPENRQRLFARGRAFMVTNQALFRDWAASLDGFLQYCEPPAGAYAFAEYHADLPSVELCDRIRERQSVLLVPGLWMGMEHHLRFGLGGPRAPFEEALRRVKLEIDAIRGSAPARSRRR